MVGRSGRIRELKNAGGHLTRRGAALLRRGCRGDPGDGLQGAIQRVRRYSGSYPEQIAGEADTNAQQDQVNQIEFESLE